MMKAFELFVGGTQRRSTGIAMLKGLIDGNAGRWRRRRSSHFASWKPATKSLLESQAAYLLTGSEEGDRPDEIYNLRGVIELLKDVEGEPSREMPSFELLRTALADRLSNKRRTADVKGSGPLDHKKLGLEVEDKWLHAWQDELSRMNERR